MNRGAVQLHGGVADRGRSPGRWFRSQSQDKTL
jgi:hypothetical protein